MTKSDAIAAIVKLNPTADPLFLSGFSNEDLVDYLQRLSSSPINSRFLDDDCCISPDDPDGRMFSATDCIS